MKTTERVEWISEEAGDLIGYGVFKKGDRFEIPVDLAKQLIYQKKVKDVYVERKGKKKDKGGK